MDFILNESIDFTEDIENEFKQFSIDTTHLSETDCEKILFSKTLLDKNIRKSISSLFKNVFEKYLKIFHNSNSGNLYLGINDDNEVSGIPFFGTKQELHDFIQDKIKKENIIDIDYSIDIIPVKISKSKMSYKKEIIDIYKTKKINKYITDFYKKKKIIWTTLFNSYTKSLETLINMKHIQNQIIQFYNLPKDYFKNKDLTIDYHYLFKNKNDPNHFMYYLTRYKDYIVDMLKQFRPIKKLTFLKKKFKVFLQNFVPFNELLYDWYKLPFYIIKIQIEKGKTFLKYKNELLFRKINSFGEPITIIY